MVSHYNYGLVALSVSIAFFASYAALDLVGRTRAARGVRRSIWLTGGASAMGLGIWTMHYIGMLAFHLPVPVLYDVPTVIVSLLAAVGVSAVALFVVSRNRLTVPGVSAGSVVMGCGIAAMHYTGMAAMRLPAMSHYDNRLVALSVACLAHDARGRIEACPVCASHRTGTRSMTSSVAGGSLNRSNEASACPSLIHASSSHSRMRSRRSASASMSGSLAVSRRRAGGPWRRSRYHTRRM